MPSPRASRISSVVASRFPNIPLPISPGLIRYPSHCLPLTRVYDLGYLIYSTSSDKEWRAEADSSVNTPGMRDRLIQGEKIDDALCVTSADGLQGNGMSSHSHPSFHALHGEIGRGQEEEDELEYITGS